MSLINNRRASRTADPGSRRFPMEHWIGRSRIDSNSTGNRRILCWILYRAPTGRFAPLPVSRSENAPFGNRLRFPAFRKVERSVRQAGSLTRKTNCCDQLPKGRQLDSLQAFLPSGFPSGYRSCFPTSLPIAFPLGSPTGFLTEKPIEFPADWSFVLNLTPPAWSSILPALDLSQDPEPAGALPALLFPVR